MNSIKTGSHISREKTTFENKGINNDSDYYGKLPYGLIPMIFNLVFFIIILLCGILIPNERLQWNDVLLIASYCSFCINILWLIFRQDFFQDGRYHMFSMWKKSFGYKFKEKILNNDFNFKTNINDSKDYKKFLKKRKDKTKILFLVSFTIHFILVIISTILIFVF